MWIKLHQKITEWEWWSEPNTAHLFIHLLAKANWKEKSWRGQIIPIGGYLTSVSKLAAETGLSEKEVRTALKHLEKTGEVAKQTTAKSTLLIVNNYALYQGVGELKAVEEAGPRATESYSKKIADFGQTGGQGKGELVANQIPDTYGINEDFQTDRGQADGLKPAQVGQTPGKVGATTTERTERQTTETQTLSLGAGAGRERERVSSGSDQTERSIIQFVNEHYTDLDLIDAWTGYIAMRKAGRRPLTLRATKILAARLDELAEDEKSKAELVDLATVRGWLNFYPPHSRQRCHTAEHELNLPDWYSTIPTERASTEDLEAVRKLQEQILGSGSSTQTADLEATLRKLEMEAASV